jgi:hypothetical protein
MSILLKKCPEMHGCIRFGKVFYLKNNNYNILIIVCSKGFC